MKGISVSKGNMYDWVTHMWSPLVGCPHQCCYCYVQSRFRNQPETVTRKEEPWPQLGGGHVYFVGHLCDLFAEAVPDEWVVDVLEWCRAFPGNDYVFQTKNPMRALNFRFPDESMLGTTIETNREDILARVSAAPLAVDRASGLSDWKGKKFLTIEPILDFDVVPLVGLIVPAMPDFVNIGADSKSHHLPEPSRTKVLALVDALGQRGITIRKKCNLERLIA